MKKQIELYDMGRCTHKRIPGMYEFVIDNSEMYISDKAFAGEVSWHAKNRLEKKASIPQTYFSALCGVIVAGYNSGEFQIDFDKVLSPETVPRFVYVKNQGRYVGVMTSGTKELVEIFYDKPIGDGRVLNQLVDYYFLGEEIGDKDFPETFAKLWEMTEGGIYAIFDDKPTVCRAAIEGLKIAGGSSKIYMVDRKDEIKAESIEELISRGVKKIRSFSEAE